MTPNPNPSPELLDEKSVCSMDVGCSEAGVCYAEANGKPFMCPHYGNADPLREALELSLAKRSVATMDPPYTAAFNAALDMVARDTATTRALSPQTLPAPGEVANLRARLVAAEHAARKWEQACQQSWDREALATVAAANDEAFARGIEAAAKVADQRVELCRDRAWQARFAVFEALPAAIRLLSQGGGK